MNAEGYSSFEDWKLDMDYVRAHPNDRVFFQHVVQRVNSSSQKIKFEVQEYLSGLAMDKNPWMVFQQVLKENPKCALIAKSQNDPWFSA